MPTMAKPLQKVGIDVQSLPFPIDIISWIDIIIV